VADSVDYLNYYVTSIMFAFFALAISAKQYFGSPIQCWVPSEFRAGWEKYAEDYCFIANSYYVPFDEEIPVDIEHRKDHISYYRWVPIMLASTAINPREFLKEAEKARYAVGEKRDKEIESLANYFMETVAVFQPDLKGKRYSSPRSGYNATLLYLFTKAAYVTNICVQIVILNHFLGQNYLNWGYEMTSNIVQGNEWKETEVFPRIRRLANLQRHTVQCVIMMNMINEKLYLFLYFWMFFLGIATIINFIYFTK
ncbi:innexin-3 domain protein, partial [Ostertagia ostertagi]